jgi:ELWxxDGT repeat protein
VFHETQNVNGTLFFTRGSGNTPTELWKSNGTPAGTVVVKSIVGGGNNAILGLTSVKNLVFFVVVQSGQNTLWRTDGTPAGTIQLLAGLVPNSDGQYSLADFHGTLFFANGSRLWKSDGTVAGTVLRNPVLRQRQPALEKRRYGCWHGPAQRSGRYEYAKPPDRRWLNAILRGLATPTHQQRHR